MTLDWQAEEADPVLKALVQRALAHIPKEHTRYLDAVTVLDHDPRGRNLGLYVRDHNGTRIELYLTPHLRDLSSVREPVASWALLLHVAHTLFHEVGHHMTLTLNRRRAPSKGRAAVTETLEKWAEEYTARRMEKFVAALEAAAGDEAERAALETAWRLLEPAAKVPARG